MEYILIVRKELVNDIWVTSFLKARICEYVIVHILEENESHDINLLLEGNSNIFTWGNNIITPILLSFLDSYILIFIKILNSNPHIIYNKQEFFNSNCLQNIRHFLTLKIIIYYLITEVGVHIFMLPGVFFDYPMCHSVANWIINNPIKVVRDNTSKYYNSKFHQRKIYTTIFS